MDADLKTLNFLQGIIAGNVRGLAPYELSILRAMQGYRDDLAG